MGMTATLARMPGFTATAAASRSPGKTNSAAPSQDCTSVCDYWDYVYYGCDGTAYSDQGECLASPPCSDEDDCCCDPSPYCVHSHTRCCTTYSGACTGAGGSDQCITAAGVTQCCHSNWLYGWWPWVTTCDDGTRNAGCSGPCW